MPEASQALDRFGIKTLERVDRAFTFFAAPDAERGSGPDQPRHLEGSRRCCYFTRPRGRSKTSGVAGVMIADLLEEAQPHSRSYAVAVDRDQGRLLVDSIVGFVESTEGLPGALRLDKWIVTGSRTVLRSRSSLPTRRRRGGSDPAGSSSTSTRAGSTTYEYRTFDCSALGTRQGSRLFG
jgi:hypothetical protein